jgi:hypothetical protein
MILLIFMCISMVIVSEFKFRSLDVSSYSQKVVSRLEILQLPKRNSMQ